MDLLQRLHSRARWPATRCVRCRAYAVHSARYTAACTAERALRNGIEVGVHVLQQSVLISIIIRPQDTEMAVQRATADRRLLLSMQRACCIIS
jgi:hypothetical protein